MDVTEREDKGKSAERIYEGLMVKKFPTSYERQKYPCSRSKVCIKLSKFKQTYPRHILIRMSYAKDKEKIPKAARET